MIVLSHSSELQRKRFKKVKRFLQLVFLNDPYDSLVFWLFIPEKGLFWKKDGVLLQGKKSPAPQHWNISPRWGTPYLFSLPSTFKTRGRILWFAAMRRLDILIWTYFPILPLIPFHSRPFNALSSPKLSGLPLSSSRDVRCSLHFQPRQLFMADCQKRSSTILGIYF